MSQGPRASFGSLPNRQFRFSSGSSSNNFTGFQSPTTSRTPATAAGTATSSAKKSSDELFKEHRDAALQWKRQRQDPETTVDHPSAVPPTPMQQDRINEEEANSGSTKEKSAEKSFQEHRDASLRWRSSQQGVSNVESAGAIPGINTSRPSPTARYGTNQQSSPEATAIASFNLTTSANGSYQTNNMRSTFDTAQRLSPIAGSDATAGPFSPILHRAPAHQSGDANTPFRAFRKAEEEFRKHEAVPHSVTMPTVEKSEPLPQQGAPLTPQEQQPDISNRTYTQWLMDVTGVSALKQYERMLVLVLFVSSPALVFLCERLILSWVPLSPLGTNAGGTTPGQDFSHHIQLVCAYFGTMTTLDAVAATVLGVALSFTLDRDTAATDALIGRTVKVIAESAERAISAVCGVFSKPRAVNRDDDSEKSTHSDHPSNDKAAPSSLMKVVTRILRLPLRIPLFMRFVMVIFIFGVTSRVVLGKVAIVVVAKTSQYLPIATVIIAVLVGLYVLFIGLRYYMRRTATRRSVVNVLSSFTKALLLQRGRAYPIVYLYEEVAETVQLYSRGGASSGLFSPLSGSKTSKFSNTSKPAAVVESSGGFLGAIRSVFGKASGGASQTSEASTPVELSAADKVELLEQAINLHDPRRDARSSKNSSGDSAEGTSPAAGPADATASPVDVMRGYKLKGLWGEVQKVVESDRRVQKVDLIMDGRKQSCWRILSGSTQAKI